MIQSQLYGSYNFNNIMAAICIGEYFNVPPHKIKEAIEEYQPSNNRSQIIEVDSNTLFLDAYNANPTSMNAAIDTFSENPAKNKMMILGDMLELGEISLEEHQKIVNKVHNLNMESIFIGKEFNQISNKYNFIFLNDCISAIDYLKHNGKIDHHILIKGSRGLKLEKIADFFQNKST